MKLFRDAEKRLPKDLDEVFRFPLPTGRSNDRNKPTTDLYGNPVVFRPDKDGKRFTVTSLGRDGKPGGSGPNADAEATGDDPATK